MKKTLSEALGDIQVFEEFYREGLELFKDEKRALRYAKEKLAIIEEDRRRLKEIIEREFGKGGKS